MRRVIDWWDRLPVLRLRLRFEPLAPFRIREFPGSMFRGAFGHSLKDLTCVRAHRTCEGCDLGRSCGYSAVFEPHRAPPTNATGPSRPPPTFLLEWPAGSDDRYVGRESFEFDIVLLAHATGLWHLIAPSFADAARRGFGSERVPHRLIDVAQVTAGGSIHHGPYEPDWLADYPLPIGLGRAWRVRAVTPLRIEEKGRLVERPTLEQILRSTERRLRLLGQTPDDSGPARVEHGWFHQARDVDVHSSTWTRHDWERFSARQHRRVPSSGMLGELRLRGDIAPFASLLRAASVVHVGKSTSSGLGRIEVEAEEDHWSRGTPHSMSEEEGVVERKSEG